MKQPKYKWVYGKSNNAPPYDLVRSVQPVAHVSRRKDAGMSAVARVNDPMEKNGYFLIRVPAVMTTIPEIPSHVIVDGVIAEKTCDAPLTYCKLDIQPVPVKRVRKK